MSVRKIGKLNPTLPITCKNKFNNRERDTEEFQIQRSELYKLIGEDDSNSNNEIKRHGNNRAAESLLLSFSSF